jgi:hypothetical protein
MTEHNLEHTIALLARTPVALDGMLRGLPEEWIMRNEGENTWSVFEVLGHLVYAERVNWIPRVKMLLQSGDSQAFRRFDRQGHRKENVGKSVGDLLDQFAQLRGANLDELRHLDLQREQLNRRGQHPTLGVVTLSELLATWAAHDLTHLHQISRIMANQYRERVGPFIAFLGVMKCSGHGS